MRWAPRARSRGRRATRPAVRVMGCGASLSLFLPFAGFLEQRQRALPLGPVAGAVLYDFLQLDLAFRHVGDQAEVLSHVVALLHAVQRLVGAYQRVHLVALRERAHHLQLLEREGLQRLLAPRELL